MDVILKVNKVTSNERAEEAMGAAPNASEAV